MEKDNLTIAILTKNSAKTISEALVSAAFADSVVVIDDISSDETVAIAKKAGAVVIVKHYAGFAAKRNAALRHAGQGWIFYLDADEVISSSLATEIEKVVKDNDPGVYAVVRNNVFLGKRMYPDSVERLFHTSVLKEWQGAVHEHPVYEGAVKTLSHHLDHFTHTDIASMLDKTNEWSEIEAQLRIDAHHPPMRWWRYISVSARVWWEQLVKKQVWRYGRAGWFEAYFQMIDKLIVYTKLWEKQQKSM